MKYTWLTDIHLNFLKKEEREDFYKHIIQENSDFILISGDIAEAPNVSELLKEMAIAIQKPIYFVLGNHDYYRGQIQEVRAAMIELTQSEGLLKWVPACEPIVLDTDVILIGQDSWADGRYGDYVNSSISLNDSRLIMDLFQQKILGKYALLEKMQELADIDANRLKESLEQVINSYNPKKIIILIHVPPFKEVCLHQGKISDDSWLPYFASKVTGDVLIEAAMKNQNIEFLVLCGHTHSSAYYQPLKNLIVKSGKAEYYQPAIQMSEG